MSSFEDSDILHGIHVLLVEDTKAPSDLLEILLQHGASVVSVAASEMDAARLLQTVRPHVIVSHLATAEARLALIQELGNLAREYGFEVPAVAFSVLSGNYHRGHALREGFKAYLTTPVDPWELRGVVVRHGWRRGPPSPAPG